MSFAYLPLYTGDYLRDTRHLTPLKHGIYLMALMYCWDTQGPMPLDEQECAGICNCRSADEVEGLRYVLRRFFVLMDDGWYNKRMADEVARAERTSLARSESGLKGAEARREKARRGFREKREAQNTASAKQVLSSCQASDKQESVSPSPSPSPSLAQPTQELSRKKAPAPKHASDFQRFWDAYPRKTSKATAEKAWSKIDQHLADMIIADVTRRRIDDPQWHEVQFIPHPSTYLNQRRWEDEILTAQSPGGRNASRPESAFDRRKRINAEIEARARAHFEEVD